MPCLTRWSPKGSITSDILIDILATLDRFKVFDRSNGKLPFLLLDGHGSRFALNFLAYVTNKEHEWCVCIGVPYGTSLWQVGDSSEQNGAYKMALSRKKELLVELKEQKMMKPTIESYKIIILINYAWDHSFARPLSNKKAIADRGWFPLNRALLTNKTLRTTMTDEQHAEEFASSIICVPPSTNNALPNSTSTAIVPITTAIIPPSPLINHQYLTMPELEPRKPLNFSQGTAAFCLDKNFRHTDLMQARERIKNERQEGKSVVEQIKEQKGAVSAGKVYNAGLVRIGQTIFDIVNESNTDNKRAAKEKGDIARLAYNAKVKSALDIKALRISSDKLTINQLKVLIAPLKRKGDGPMPTKKAVLLETLMLWEGRGMLTVDEEVAIAEAEVAMVIHEENEPNADGSDLDKLVQMEEV